MNKPKNFFFAVAITVIMLFILGNWSTSAQATGVTIIGATPTPISTPVEDHPTNAGCYIFEQ